MECQGSKTAFIGADWLAPGQVRPLHSGDYIQIGGVRIRFLLPDVPIGETGADRLEEPLLEDGTAITREATEAATGDVDAMEEHLTMRVKTAQRDQESPSSFLKQSHRTSQQMPTQSMLMASHSQETRAWSSSQGRHHVSASVPELPESRNWQRNARPTAELHHLHRSTVLPPTTTKPRKEDSVERLCLYFCNTPALYPFCQ